MESGRFAWSAVKKVADPIRRLIGGSSTETRSRKLRRKLYRLLPVPPKALKSLIFPTQARPCGFEPDEREWRLTDKGLGPFSWRVLWQRYFRLLSPASSSCSSSPRFSAMLF